MVNAISEAPHCRTKAANVMNECMLNGCVQVAIQDLENSFMFNTGFQSSSAIAKQMEYAVGTLSIYPDFLADLRKELDGKVCVCVCVWAYWARMVLLWSCVDT